jgi:hypothetical protein
VADRCPGREPAGCRVAALAEGPAGCRAVTGGLARHVGQVLGVGSAVVTTWDIAKWPVLFILVCIMIGVLYWASPNARHGFRWIGPGAVIAVVIWLIASGLFALYVTYFGDYNKVYGTIAGMIIFLIWLWVTISPSCWAPSSTRNWNAGAPWPQGSRPRPSPTWKRATPGSCAVAATGAGPAKRPDNRRPRRPQPLTTLEPPPGSPGGGSGVRPISS